MNSQANPNLTVGLPLGADLEVTILDAMKVQTKACDEKLRADHLVVALCGDGEIIIDFGGVDRHAAYPVNVATVRSQMQDKMQYALAAKLRSGSPPPRICGCWCMPLEETVALYVIAQCIWHIISLILMPFTVFAHGSTVELLLHALGALFSIVGLNSISSHRAARMAVKEAAYRSGASWEAELDVAFDLIKMEPQFPKWYRMLREGANRMQLVVVWSLADAVFDLPIFGMVFIEMNTCGAHHSGLQWVLPAHFMERGYLLHCKSDDVAFFAVALAIFMLKAYMCWAILALWHEYAHGWTTLDIRGLSLFGSVDVVPEAVVRVLAGLPRHVRASADVKSSIASETTPLML